MRVAHYVICRPGKEGARQRLTKAGIEATVYAAITPGGLSDTLAQTPYLRFGGGTIKRTPAQHGAWLSHVGVLLTGRSLAKAGALDWLGVWEEDAALAQRVGWAELPLPEKVGVVYLGGALWGDAGDYGEVVGSVGATECCAGATGDAGLSAVAGERRRAQEAKGSKGNRRKTQETRGKQPKRAGARLWSATKAKPISCTHAVMIHARAMDDVLASYARADMTIDDLLSCACMEAAREGRWVTCFVQPWLVWQEDRRETWPRSTIE